MAQIVVVGEILAELMATQIGQTFLQPGLFAGPFPSGAPGIFADQAARTGATVALVGTVGDDPFGTVNLDRLRSSGVDVSEIRRHPSKPTGTAFVTYAEDGSRSFIFNINHSAAGDVKPEQLTSSIFEGCRFFHIMGSSLINTQMTSTIQHGVRLARAVGAKISFDPNIRKELVADAAADRAIRDLFAQADLLLPSEDDLAYLLPGLTCMQAAETMLARGMRLVLLKRGQGGCTLFEGSGATHLQALPAREIDPTGAGDCFGGTFLSCLVQGMEPTTAALFANAAGALAVAAQGPMEGNSTLAEIERYRSQAVLPAGDESGRENHFS